MNRNAILCGLLMCIVCASVAAQTNKAKLPTGNVKQLAVTVLQKARTGDKTLVLSLVKKFGDDALSALDEGVTDPNDDIRSLMEDAARSVRSPKSLEVLTRLAADKNVSIAEHVVRSLYQDFSREQIKQSGGQALKNNLLAFLKVDFNSAEAILLLSSFTGDIEVQAFLNQLRGSHESSKTKLGFSGSLADLTVCIDLALAQIGQPRAIEKVRQTIQDGTPDNVLFLVHALKYISSQTLISALVETLRDGRETSQIFGPVGDVKDANAPPLPPPPHLRVCDAALVALAQKTGVDVGVPDVVAALRARQIFVPYRHFSEKELARAYARLSAAFPAAGR